MDRLPAGVSVSEEGTAGQRGSSGLWSVRALTGECRSSARPDPPGDRRACALPGPAASAGPPAPRPEQAGEDTWGTTTFQAGAFTAWILRGETQAQRRRNGSNGFRCFIML